MSSYAKLDSKERNRAHAKKTRMRKRIALDNLRNRIAVLQKEAISLQAEIDEKSMANILMGLGDTAKNPPSNNAVNAVFTMGSSQKISFLDSDAHKVVADLRVAVRIEAACQRRQELLNSRRHSSPDGRAIIKEEADQISTKDVAESGTAEGLLKGNESLTEDGDFDSDSSGEEFGDNGLEEESTFISVTNTGKGDSSATFSTSDIDSNSNNNPDVRCGVVAEEVARRQRNKYHARLTRDRKKIFTQRLGELIRAMEGHNARLKIQLRSLGGTTLNVESTLPSESSRLLVESRAGLYPEQPLEHLMYPFGMPMHVHPHFNLAYPGYYPMDYLMHLPMPMHLPPASFPLAGLLPGMPSGSSTTHPFLPPFHFAAHGLNASESIPITNSTPLAAESNMISAKPNATLSQPCASSGLLPIGSTAPLHPPLLLPPPPLPSPSPHLFPFFPTGIPPPPIAFPLATTTIAPLQQQGNNEDVLPRPVLPYSIYPIHSLPPDHPIITGLAAGAQSLSTSLPPQASSCIADARTFAGMYLLGFQTNPH